MASDTDNLNLTDRQKTRLLDLALDPANVGVSRSGDEERGDLLHDLLRCFLPFHNEPRKDACTVAAAPGQSLRSVVGPPIGALLQDSKTSIAVLKEIKQHAKKRGSQATSEREEDAFLAIYVAAIAGALVYHAEHITEHPDADMTRFFDHYASAEWVPNDLRELLQRAAQHLSQPKRTQV